MIVLFEDKYSVERLFPFSPTRPLQDLKTGILTVYERLSYLYNFEVKVISRKEMLFYFPETKVLSMQDLTKKNEIIFINSCYVYPSEDFRASMNTVGTYEGTIIYLHTRSSEIQKPELLYDGLYQNDIQKIKDSINTPIEEIKIQNLKNFIFYPWDTVYLNSSLMVKDFELLSNRNELIGGNQSSFDVQGNKELLFISPKAVVSKGVFIDTTQGPVYIDSEATIHPLTVITGPTYIGKRTVISQARIREGCNIRNVCKVSGEVEESIIDSYTNKNHEGFIGHSYIGQWVNIGAMATNSDLKNTYDEVKVFIQPRKVINTGILKVGCFIGDFSKIGIGVLINTGTVIGVGANVFFEGELVRKFVPNFAWGGKEPYKKFPLDRFLSMTKTMFSRRGKNFDKSIEDLLVNLYNQNKV